MRSPCRSPTRRRAERGQARGGALPGPAEPVPVKQALEGPPPATARPFPATGPPLLAMKAVLEAKPVKKQSTLAKVDDLPKKYDNTKAIQSLELIPPVSDVPTTTAAAAQPSLTKPRSRSLWRSPRKPRPRILTLPRRRGQNPRP